MNQREKQIQNLLNQDPLGIAEEITGKSYKSDPETVSKGFLLHLHKSQAVKNILKENDDTVYRENVQNYLRIAKDIGFEVVMEKEFKGELYKDYFIIPEREFTLFHKECGALIHVDTFQEEKVNSASMYYNIKPLVPGDIKSLMKMTSSGHWEHPDHEDLNSLCPLSAPKEFQEQINKEIIWVGKHDAREALRHHFGILKNNSIFVTPWVAQPFLWLLNYMDTKEKSYNFEKINNKKIKELPKHVQTAIKGKKRK